MTTINERLRSARKSKGLTQQDLARLARVAQSTISDFERGRSSGSTELPALSKALGVSLDYLIYGKEGTVDLSTKQPLGSYQVKYVPIKGSARMGPDGYFNNFDSFAIEDGDGYVPSIVGSPNAYALRGTGGSMHPVIRDGWFVVCDPDTNPVAGEFVLVCINNERCIIKEFMTQRDGLLHLNSVNTGERMTLDLVDVTAIVPIVEIMPPSRRVLEIPTFDV